MRNVILLSADLTKGRSCSMEMARKLLHQGLARIVQFYPYTLQLKGLLDLDNGKEPLEDDQLIPGAPLNPPPTLTKRLKLRMKNKATEEFKVFRHIQKLRKPLKKPLALMVRKPIKCESMLENGVF